MRRFLLWLLSIAVPLAFAVCLLVLFPKVLENRFFIALSYFVGIFFLVAIALVTWSFLMLPKLPRQKDDDDRGDYQI